MNIIFIDYREVDKLTTLILQFVDMTRYISTAKTKDMKRSI